MQFPNSGAESNPHYLPDEAIHEAPTPHKIESDRELELLQALQQIEQMDTDDTISRYHEALATDNTYLLDAALDALPQHNLPHARAVYTAFAENPLIEIRCTGAMMPQHLTPFDHDYGLQLWNQLIRDVDEEVRFCAYENLRGVLDDEQSADEESAERELREYGITWRDAFGLLHSYIRAERGTDHYDINAGRS